jgi:citrate lyase beta subunit
MATPLTEVQISDALRDLPEWSFEGESLRRSFEFADFRDLEGYRKSCLLARALGYDGKWCIHPAQIETVNEVFTPTEREIEWARKVVKAYEEAGAAGRGAISVDGQMIDAASIRMARTTLDLI